MDDALPAAKPVATLKDQCERAKLSDDAKVLLKPEHTPRQFLDLLIAKELFLDAVNFLAYVLPKRESVGWGCLCVRQSLGTESAAKMSEAHVAAERWVANPNEENRRAAELVVKKSGLESPPSFLALAAFFSGGSIAPSNLEPVAPPDHATPQLVAGAVMVLAVKTQPEKAPEKYRVFLQKGMALLNRIQAA